MTWQLGVGPAASSRFTTPMAGRCGLDAFEGQQAPPHRSLLRREASCLGDWGGGPALPPRPFKAPAGLGLPHLPPAAPALARGPAGRVPGLWGPSLPARGPVHGCSWAKVAGGDQRRLAPLHPGRGALTLMAAVLPRGPQGRSLESWTYQQQEPMPVDGHARPPVTCREPQTPPLCSRRRVPWGRSWRPEALKA